MPSSVLRGYLDKVLLLSRSWLLRDLRKVANNKMLRKELKWNVTPLLGDFGGKVGYRGIL